jgi:hypothetical protein
VVTVKAADYEAWKGFLGWMVDHVLTLPPGLSADDHPLALAARIEAESMAEARRGLGQAIAFMIEDTDRLPRQRVEEIDRALAAQGLPTLSQMRARLWSKVTRIMKRGTVRTEDDYHALRSVVDSMSEAEQATGWRILGDFETSISGQVRKEEQ